MTTLTNSSTLTLSSLGINEQIADFVSIPSGVILISGQIASGKTTTLRALVNELDANGRPLTQLIEAENTEKVCSGGFITARHKTGPIHISKATRDEKIQEAYRYAYQTVGELLALDSLEVVIIDDMRSPATALIASMLAEAGVLVIASIHNSDTIDNTVNRFAFLTSHLRSGINTDLVVSVAHQKLVDTPDGKKIVLARKNF